MKSVMDKKDKGVFLSKNFLHDRDCGEFSVLFSTLSGLIFSAFRFADHFSWGLKLFSLHPSLQHI